jgi:hypothetical protein
LHAPLGEDLRGGFSKTNNLPYAWFSQTLPHVPFPFADSALYFSLL